MKDEGVRRGTLKFSVSTQLDATYGFSTQLKTQTTVEKWLVNNYNHFKSSQFARRCHLH